MTTLLGGPEEEFPKLVHDVGQMLSSSSETVFCATHEIYTIVWTEREVYGLKPQSKRGLDFGA